MSDRSPRGGSGRERFDNGERHDDRRYAGNGDRRSRSPRRGRDDDRSRRRSYSRSPPPRRRSRSPPPRGRRYSPPPRRPEHRRPYQTKEERENPPESNVIGCFGLSDSTQNRDLEDVFGKFGRLQSCKLIHDRMSGRSKGFGFITFDDVKDAADAVREMNGRDIQGRVVRVAFSLTKRPHSPTPGQFMGDERQRMIALWARTFHDQMVYPLPHFIY